MKKVFKQFFSHFRQIFSPPNLTAKTAFQAIFFDNHQIKQSSRIFSGIALLIKYFYFIYFYLFSPAMLLIDSS
jgi:hypothetical protein